MEFIPCWLFLHWLDFCVLLLLPVDFITVTSLLLTQLLDNKHSVIDQICTFAFGDGRSLDLNVDLLIVLDLILDP